MSYSQPLKTFSTRFHTKPSRRNRNPEDAALVNHVHASIYPFHSQPVNSCYPHQPPSRKLKTFSRGTFATDTLANSGWGYVYTCPCAASNPTTSQMGQSQSIATTNDQFTSPFAITTNSPYVTADFGAASLTSRFVSCGLRVRNITPMLDRGGTLYALKSPNDYLLPGATFNSLIADLDVTGNCWRCDTSGGKWSYLAWCPGDRDQMEFTNNSVAFDQTNSTLMARTLAFVAQSTPGIVQTYEWEIVEHFEVNAQGSSGDLLHSNTRGLSHPHVEKANQIVNDLHRRPQIMENESSSALSSFIADVVTSGNDVKSIVDCACDIASKTAAVLPKVYAATRALGSFL